MQDLPQEPLAVTFAVDQRRVDEVQAQLEGAAQRRQGFLVRAALERVATNAPGPEAHIADFQLCLS